MAGWDPGEAEGSAHREPPLARPFSCREGAALGSEFEGWEHEGAWSDE